MPDLCIRLSLTCQFPDNTPAVHECMTKVFFGQPNLVWISRWPTDLSAKMNSYCSKPIDLGNFFFFYRRIAQRFLRVPWTARRSVNPKGNPPRIIGRTNAEDEVPIFCPPVVKSGLIGKDHDAWKDWGWEKNRVTEDEMVGWHHQLNGHKFE